MARYDDIYAILAERAIGQGALDFKTFLRTSAARGISADRIEEMLEHDLDTGGPIFGKFLRSLTGAASNAVSTASYQAMLAASLDIDGDAELERLTGLSKMDDVIEEAGPEDMEAVGGLANETPMIWIATMVNTCHLCLPLHGKTMSKAGWEELGLSPISIHANEGWDSACKCKLIVSESTRDRGELIAPLLRQKLDLGDGRKGGKRTVRAVTQQDMDKSLDAMQKAMETKTGRRILRLLGQSGG